MLGQDKEIIMAVETSCDETAVAILAEGKDLLTNIVSSQIKVHQQYGGVVLKLLRVSIWNRLMA